MTEPLDLDALEALERAATPGPWQYTDDEDSAAGAMLIEALTKSADGKWYQMVWRGCGSSGEVQEDADGEFIVAARNALPELIRRARLLENATDALRTARPTMLRLRKVLLHMGGSNATSMHYREYLRADRTIRSMDAIVAESPHPDITFLRSELLDDVVALLRGVVDSIRAGDGSQDIVAKAEHFITRFDAEVEPITCQHGKEGWTRGQCDECAGAWP